MVTMEKDGIMTNSNSTEAPSSSPSRRWWIVGTGIVSLTVTIALYSLQTTRNAHAFPSRLHNATASSSHNATNGYPDVCWIMSFGGSGTSYTILNTEFMTGETTASNYGADYRPYSVPVHPQNHNGPFVRSPQKPLPKHYILTKTHCGGFCMDCPPSKYDLSQTAFARSCLSGSKHTARGEDIRMTYSSDIPKRAIHLVRNPFDNVVGRFHLSVRHWKQRAADKDDLVSDYEQLYPNNATGLSAWCQTLDDKYLPDEEQLLQDYLDVPCHAEWYRYIQWHNKVNEVIKHLQLPVHYLWYDNYTMDFDSTTTELFAFLQTKAVSDPYPWRGSTKTYSDFFERASLPAQMMRELSSELTWSLIRHYVEPFLPMEAHDDGDDDDTTTTPPSQPSSQIAWLLSFPNSGTSYTIMNVEHMANVTTASNYVKDFEQLVPVASENGPFLHKPDLERPKWVLSKTHCTGYCEDCPPDSYLVSTVDDFERGCRECHLPQNVYYDSADVGKIVHLFRDPFDNVVSRMHLAMKNHPGATMENNKKGFLEWCQYLDETYRKAERAVFDAETLQLMQQVPCHADFYRYAQWHNWALAMSEALNVPVYYLYYDKYTTQYDETVQELFEFLEIEAKRPPKPFVTGKTYHDYYNDEQQQAAKALLQKVSSPATWEHMARYFD